MSPREFLREMDRSTVVQPLHFNQRSGVELFTVGESQEGRGEGVGNQDGEYLENDRVAHTEDTMAAVASEDKNRTGTG